MSRYTTALVAALRSGDNEFRMLAVRRIEAILESQGGNLLRAARESGLSHRTLCRWIEGDADLRSRLERIRSVHDTNVIEESSTKQAKV